MNEWFAHLQYILKEQQENKSSHLFEALTDLCQQCSEEIWLPLCWISSSFSGLLVSHFTLPQLTPVCPNPILCTHPFCIEQSAPWLALVLWLLKFSSNLSEVRTRTRTRSFKLIKQLLNFSTSVSDLTPLWESPDLHRVSWIFSSLHCLKIQLCTKFTECWLLLWAILLFHGKKYLASCP